MAKNDFFEKTLNDSCQKRPKRLSANNNHDSSNYDLLVTYKVTTVLSSESRGSINCREKG